MNSNPNGDRALRELAYVWSKCPSTMEASQKILTELARAGH